MNAATLAERGIWVPRALVPDPIRGPYNHMYLSTASRLSISKPDDLQRQLGLLSMDLVNQHRNAIIQSLQSERNALSFVPSIIIVSCEHVHGRLRTDFDLAYAKAILEPFCSAFRVVVYLRSQYELAQSIAVTAVREGATEFRPIPNFNGANGYDDVLGVDYSYFDYFELLQRIKRVFGSRAIDVRIFEKNQLYNDDVVQDFFKRINCDIADMPQPRRENTSLDPAAILFLLKLNIYLKATPQAAAIRGRVLSYLALTHPGGAQPAPSSEINGFNLRFAKSNDAIRSRWFPEQKVLFSERAVDADYDSAGAALSEASTYNMFIELFKIAMRAH